GYCRNPPQTTPANCIAISPRVVVPFLIPSYYLLSKFHSRPADRLADREFGRNEVGVNGQKWLNIGGNS
ncbi:MAG: hypothetical protein ACYTEU_13835, partial [Planctomycetota bacterium]